MLSSINQLTTVVSSPGLPFSSADKTPSPIKLYFHLTLQIEGGALDDEQILRLRQYIAGFVRAGDGEAKAVACAKGEVFLLIGLNHTRSLADFVRDLKLTSKIFARRKLNAAGFSWREQYEAFTVSLSQIDRVRSYIFRRTMLDSRESYGSSWQRLSTGEKF